jgi:glucose-1-phosphate cytidylyltransferase
MKVVILAGGYGTRLSEETSIRPKPMVEIGGKPILWHIMKIFSAYGHNDFIICAGYKGYVIKEFFANYTLQRSDVTFDIARHKLQFHNNGAEPWQVTVVDTGETSMTGGRLKRVQSFLGAETFFMTYGDGVSNVDLDKLLAFHREQKTLATVTAVVPPGRFGGISLEENKTKVMRFREKPPGDSALINGGFFVLEPRVLDYIADDTTVWEQEPMTRLAREGQLAAYRHDDFWQCMDTLRDKHVLEEMWKTEKAPWKVW